LDDVHARPKCTRRAALAALVVVSGISGQEARADDDEVLPIVVRGPVRTHPWMLRAGRAGFRDVGPLVGLEEEAPSYSVVANDMNADGWTDLVISRHGTDAALLLTEIVSGVPVGFVTAWQFHDDIHDRVDRHGCADADVDLDGLEDVYCAKGANGGTARKWNELWIQSSDGTFTDRAAEFGVEDVWGRGRFPVFLDLNHDPWPDLFAGNDAPRTDRHRTPNRTFVGLGGVRFEQVHLGVTKEIGDRCTTVADYDGNGWDDVLVCGRDRMHLYRRRSSGFRDVTEAAGLPGVLATAARFADLDGNGRLDLVFTQKRRLTVALQGHSHRFSTVLHRPLRHGHGLAVGNPDGDRDPDIYVVEGCVDGRDMPDWLFVVSRGARSFEPQRAGRVATGCGDTAEAFDFDRDGMDEFVVLNGGGIDQQHAGLTHNGPERLLTLGDWQPPAAR
jgi:FG-GAP-like repeat